MVRNTPELLQQRSCDMSLQDAASASSQELFSILAPRADFDAQRKRPLTMVERAFTIGDLITWPSVKLCGSCYGDIPQGQSILLPLERTNERSQCSACMVMDAKPQAFTKPFCAFLEDNPTVFHAVDYFKNKMRSLRYKEVGTGIHELGNGG